MIAEGQGAAIAHLDFLALQVKLEKVVDHVEGLRGSDYSGIGIYLQKIGDIGCVVRLHVLDDQIIRLPVLQYLLDIVEPLMGEIGVHGVHHRDFLVQDYVRIIGHAVWHLVLAFEKIHLVVVYAYIFDGIGHFHSSFLLFSGRCVSVLCLLK